MRYSVFILLTIPLSCQGQNKGENYIRKPAVSGSFYPSDPVQLKSQLESFYQSAGNTGGKSNIAAVIVPHAGYVYSGKVAATAFAQIDPEREYARIFMIGTSHHVYLKGASVFKMGNFSTPLGIIEVDTTLAGRLIRENPVFEDVPGAHDKEHSLEVELPFLQYRLKKPFKIVPIIIGTQSEATCLKIADALKPYFNDDNLFVISSDFSHYPDYLGAVEADKTTGDAIATNSPEKFLKARTQNDLKNIPGLVTSCCGWSSILTLLYLSSESKGISVQHIQYKNSGDTEYGDKSRVVGYQSFVFTREKQYSKPAGFSLSTNEKIQLLKLARTTIDDRLNNQRFTSVDEPQLPEALKTQCGAFVTLRKKGQLRGCIGRFITTEPLYKVVQQMAVSAAFQDPRFQPVENYEMEDIEVEISVLTPLKKIQNIDEFEYGKQGIYIVKGNRSGTFLPQVADETKWNKEEFLGHCARDKAGIGWDGWKDADLFTYEALVFSEKELLHSKK
jgi:AmmeMemoRadiSam system protein B/AmmeMemoRadiSam system protein A